jgi:hypothetical protein
MARRQGPQLLSLIYAKAFEADDLMRPEAATPIKARDTIGPATGRIDSCIPSRRHQKITLRGRRP